MKQKNKNKNVFAKAATVVAFIGLTTLAGCADGGSSSVPQAGKSISDTLGCEDIKSNIFNTFYEVIDKDRKIPSPQELKDAVHARVDAMSKSLKSETDQLMIDKLHVELDRLVELMLQEFADNPNLTWNEMIQKLIEYEMEDQSEQKIVQATEDINQQVERIKSLSQDLDLPCNTPSPTPSPDEPSHEVPPTPPVAGIPSISAISKGLNMVFATAYQSCDALNLPPMTSATPNVAGISVVGKHSDGVGSQRAISSISSVASSHYYIKGQQYPGGCFAVNKNPLIYDYGGSPKFTTSTLNFFEDSGSGTSVLGVDCSAYVSSGIAVAGLRYKPGLDNKPVYVRQSSSKFISAAKSGFSCFENIKISREASIKAGDVVGVSGHMLVVDRVGNDPFGFKNFKTESQCEGLNYKNFDITINQSSPVKNGIGINKYEARDYLSESTKMRTAFVEIGKLACLAYLQNKTTQSPSSEWGFLRHKGTSECKAPRVTMVGESCVQKCL